MDPIAAFLIGGPGSVCAEQSGEACLSQCTHVGFISAPRQPFRGLAQARVWHKGNKKEVRGERGRGCLVRRRPAPIRRSLSAPRAFARAPWKQGWTEMDRPLAFLKGSSYSSYLLSFGLKTT